MGSMKMMSLLTATLGVISFVLGVIAENKKPAGGTPITGKDVVICKYPKDPTVVLGILSVIFLFASSAVGYLSLFKSYQGKSVPRSALFQSTSFSVFFNIALKQDSMKGGNKCTNGGMLLWRISEMKGLHMMGIEKERIEELVLAR